MEMQNGAAGANREATDRASCLAQVVVFECVPAGTRPEIVCSIPADKEVVSGPAVEAVIARASEQAIITFNPGERIFVGVADECIVARGAYRIRQESKIAARAFGTA